MNATTAAVLEARHGEAVVLEKVAASAVLDDLLARVTMTQHYRNTRKTNIEAVYTFPLPPDAVLLDFEVEIGERKLTGVVVGKVEAERRYEEAITEGDTAVMLEQAGPGVYTASVGNILPGETASVRFRYGTLLRWNGDRFRFMMPTTIAPRYGDPAGGGLQPHQFPEFSFDTGRDFSLRVEVIGTLAKAGFSSPSHGIVVSREDGRLIVETAGNPPMDRDFVLEARAEPSQSAGAVASRDGDGWIVLASFCPQVHEEASREPRSVKIVVDCSGSMQGDSIAQARVALERIIDGLRHGDLFNIVAFGSHHRALFDHQTPVSDSSILGAHRFVAGLDADMGGTEIGAALDTAYALRGEDDLAHDLLLITDGEVWETAPIIGNARESRHRIFAVGVGNAVAEAFLREITQATGGACELVSPREDMAAGVHRHFQRMYAPRAKSAVIRWPAAPSRSYPEDLKTVYGGDTLHAFAWFNEEPDGLVSLDYELSDGRTARYETAVREFDTEDGVGAAALPSTLARLAAAARLPGIEDDAAAAELAERYQVMSRWTNYVLVHVRAEDAKAGDLPELEKVKQELAAGWHGLGTVTGELRQVVFERGLDANRVRSAPSADFLSQVFGSAPPGYRSRIRQSRSGFDSEAKGLPGSVVRRVSPGDLFIVWLQRDRIPPLPTLDDLEISALPRETLASLRRIAADSGDEEAVVAAFLTAFVRSAAGRAVDRHIRRRIAQAAKDVAVPAAIAEQIDRVVESYRGRPVGASEPRRSRSAESGSTE